MINQNLNLTKFADPYPGLKIENFFDEKFYLQLEKDFPSDEKFSTQKNNVKRMSTFIYLFIWVDHYNFLKIKK